MHRNDSYHTGAVRGSPELIPREILTAGGNRPMDAVLFDAPEPRQSGWDHECRNHGADAPPASVFGQLVRNQPHRCTRWSANDQFSPRPEISLRCEISVDSSFRSETMPQCNGLRNTGFACDLPAV